MAEWDDDEPLTPPVRPVEPHRRLAAAVLDLAVRDAERGDTGAQRFLVAGESLPFWCELADFDAAAVSERCRQRWPSS